MRPQSGSSPPHNLPLELSSFIGREREIETVKRHLAESRLVTLTGPGGCGKTRLALQVACNVLDGFHDGVWWVELAPLTDEDLVPQTVAQMLDVHPVAGQTLADSLANFLRKKHALLIIDNCEHLIQACAFFAESLLSNCPDLRILTTTREPLSIDGETIYPVPPLSLPEAQASSPVELSQFEAVRLFVERAGAVRPEFRLTEQNASAVKEICARLDGIPLAIELAAARIKVLSAEQIAGRLNDRFNLLTIGRRTALPRHQTLRALIAWSYDLLSEAERSLLRRLSVFVGGCNLEAAEAVCSGEGIAPSLILDLLTRLADKSLVLAEQQAGSARYGMLETIRQYAQEQLVRSEEEQRVRQQHLQFFLRFAEEAEPYLTSSERELWLRRLEADHDNLRAALEWAETAGDSEAARRLVGSLAWFWRYRNHAVEGRRWVERALAIPLDRSKAIPNERAHRAKALLAGGWLGWCTGDFLGTRSQFEESLALYREIGDRRGEAYALAIMGGQVAEDTSDFALARGLLEESVIILRGLVREDRAILDSGPNEANTSRRERADQWWLALSLHYLGDTIHKHDLERAWPILEEALTMARRLDDRWLIGRISVILGSVDSYRGNWAQARARFEESYEHFQEVGYKPAVAWARAAMGEMGQQQGDLTFALRCYKESLSLFREAGHTNGTAWMLYRLGSVALHEGESRSAEKLFAESLTLRNQVGNLEGLAEALDGLAGVAAADRQPERAVRLFAATEALRNSKHIPLRPLFREPIDRFLPVARALLEPRLFAAAWAEGQAMTSEQAIEYALGDNLPSQPGAATSAIAASSKRASKEEFAGLTVREREVAALIAQGKSNRAIAEALVVQVKTVEVHITHILDKLGFTSRAQIAGWAIGKGLAAPPRDTDQQLLQE